MSFSSPEQGHQPNFSQRLGQAFEQKNPLMGALAHQVFGGGSPAHASSLVADSTIAPSLEGPATHVQTGNEAMAALPNFQAQAVPMNAAPALAPMPNYGGEQQADLIGMNAQPKQGGGLAAILKLIGA